MRDETKDNLKFTIGGIAALLILGFILYKVIFWFMGPVLIDHVKSVLTKSEIEITYIDEDGLSYGSCEFRGNYKGERVSGYIKSGTDSYLIDFREDIDDIIVWKDEL